MNMAETMDGTTENNGNIQPNPFMLPTILKVLFKQLSPEYLAKYRLVCWMWYNESLSNWRSNATLKFAKDGIVSTQDDGSTLTTSLGKFLALWEDRKWGFNSHPFEKFTLHSWKFQAGDVDQQQFLDLVGGHITSLTLIKCSFVRLDHFRRIVYSAFPKLQFLKIDHCQFHHLSDRLKYISLYREPAFGVHGLQSLDISHHIPDTMIDILSHFHKLQSLRVRVTRSGFRRLLETISLIRAEDKTKLPFKNFDVDFVFQLGGWTTYSMELLKKLNEQLNILLQRLAFWFDDDDQDMDFNLNDENVIREILQGHSTTLKYLEFREHFPGFSTSFPPGFDLQNLEKLVIPPALFDNLNYLRSVPNLRVLEIRGHRPTPSESDGLFSNSKQLEIGGWALPSLTDLTFSAPVSVCNLEKLMKWMPNVERLKGLELDDVTFAIVCERWNNLQQLQDDGAELTDEGVIGRGNSRGSGFEGGAEEIHIAPNITKLKNLTSFATFSRNLTSPSVHDGFLKLAYLKEIWLGSSTELDGEAKAALQRRRISATIV